MKKNNIKFNEISIDSIGELKNKVNQKIKNNGSAKNKSNLEKIEEYLNDKYKFRYNIIQNEVEYKHQDEADKNYKAMKISNIWRELKKNFFKTNLAELEALFSSDFIEAYDPYHEYFSNLAAWNANTDKDYIAEFGSFVASKEQNRFIHHFKKHLVRTVACALDEKYFNKHALIIVGKKQNTGKSSWCRYLIPPELDKYYTESFETDKDGEIAMSRNFIINLDELASLDRNEVKKLKALFSYKTINRRHPYGRKPVVTPRRASFIGSTNEFDFLSDETGSVRWLCFEINYIDWNYTNININDVWSQAYQLYKSGKFDYNLTKEEIKENEIANKTYQKPSAELDLVNKYYTPGTKDDFEFFYQASEILEELKRKTEKSIRINYIVLGKALTSLGFERKSRRIKGENPVWGYYMKIKNIEIHIEEITLPKKK